MTSGQATINTTSGTPAGPINLPNAAATKQVIIRSFSGNIGKVYIGTSELVTINNGLELIPGDSVTLLLSNVNLIFCVANLDGQLISWTAV
jgi:hypothetical protein